MPELPEVETMVRGIRDDVAGRVIASVITPECRYRPISIKPGLDEIRRRAEGRTVTSVSRLAKRIVLNLDSGDAFAVEPRMTGLMLLKDAPSQEHLRFEWKLSPSTGKASSLWFWDRRGLGTIRFLSQSELASLVGPDALTTTAEDWATICRGAKTPIKVLMLNQQKVAGIGNLYASEILHLAKIDPRKPAGELKKSDLERTANATLAVLNLAIQYEGSTLSDGTYRNALNKSGGYQNEHRVYQKHSQICPSCHKGSIERIVQAQRSTFFCPRCQK